MKPNQAINQLFDHARELPAEIQLEQVETMISSLPLAAAGLSWIYKIYLKSLFMPSVSVILVAGSVLLMTGLSKEDIQSQTATPGTSNVISYLEVAPEEIPADVILLDTLEQPQPAPSPNPTPEPNPEPTPEPSPMPSPEPSVEPISEPVEVYAYHDGVVKADKKEKEKKKEKRAKSPKVKADKKVKEKKKEKDPKVKSKEKVKADKSGYEHLRRLSPTLANENKLGEKQMMRLKRTLYKELVADGLINSKKATVLLQFLESEIIVNKQILDSGLYSKYTKLLLESGAEPSPDFQVRMSPEYILVGEFTDEGFKGIGRGKGMELKFITGDNEDFWSINSPENDLLIKLSNEGSLFNEEH